MTNSEKAVKKITSFVVLLWNDPTASELDTKNKVQSTKFSDLIFICNQWKSVIHKCEGTTIFVLTAVTSIITSFCCREVSLGFTKEGQSMLGSTEDALRNSIFHFPLLCWPSVYFKHLYFLMSIKCNCSTLIATVLKSFHEWNVHTLISFHDWWADQS